MSRQTRPGTIKRRRRAATTHRSSPPWVVGELRDARPYDERVPTGRSSRRRRISENPDVRVSVPDEAGAEMAATNRTEVRRGDVVEVAGHGVGRAGRSGEILEVLGARAHRHYRVRWDDGRVSLYYPGSDAVIRRAQPGRARK